MELRLTNVLRTGKNLEEKKAGAARLCKLATVIQHGGQKRDLSFTTDQPEPLWTRN